MEYVKFTSEQLEQANQIDLEEFLLQHREKLLRAGPEKRMESNHSITIRGCQWFDHADQKGGRAISFVQRYMDVSFQEAVQVLLGEEGVLYSPAQPRKVEPPKPFVLPPAHTDNRRMRAYLERTRKISGDVLRIFEKEGLIYEDSQYHNAVFVGFDENGVARHAHKRSTNTQGKRFTINVEGCDPRYSFHWTGFSDTIYVFEAPIDMMSFISMKADWKQHSYVALCGVAEHSLIQQLEVHPQLSNIVLCLDYDKAGIQARKRITQILQDRGYHQVSSLLSFTKDWNEDLQRGIVMTEKVREFLTLSQETTVAITQDREKWQTFLRTSGQMCKYSFNDQVLIFAQRPEATACAEYDVWNKTMRRYVKRGAKGIALLDAQGDHLMLRHVFDISDTVGREDSRIVNLWEVTDRHVPEVQQAIKDTFGVPIDNNTLAEQIEMVATLQWMYKWIDHKQELLDIIDDKLLEKYDESTIQEMFRSAVVSSVTYTVCSRCLKDGPEITANAFRDIAQFASPRMANALGETVTGLNTEIFRIIEHTIKQVEKEERGKNYGNRVQEKRRGFRPGSGVNRYRQDVDWTMGADAQTVSEGTQTVRLQHYGDGADPVSPPSGDRPGSSRQDGNSDAAAGQGGGSHGGAEKEGHDEVGGPDEHLQGPSGGDYPGGIDLQLIVGRITYAYDTPEEFTNAEDYLQTIRNELPYMVTTGMRFKTLTKDPEVRKAVDDIVYDFNGEKNPRPLAHYQGNGRKVPGKEGKAKER